jgi:tripartite-type tricarboxylate transporter receptor subunit TctC
MKTIRLDSTTFLLSAFTIGAAFSFAVSATPAYAWPDRDITVVVAFGAGGGTDRQTRIMAQHLQSVLGVNVNVQNAPGGGGQVGALTVLREEPDGYTILSTNDPDHSMTIALQNAPYSGDDWEILAVDIYDPRLIVVAKDSPYQTWASFVEAARANPGTLSVSAVAGGAQDLFGRWIMNMFDLDVNHVGYPSGGEAGSAVLGGHVTANIGDDFSRLNMRDDVRGLLLGSPNASPRWPEATLVVDALAAEGLEAPTPDFLARYHFYAVPAAMREQHPENFQKLKDAIISIREIPEYKEFIATGGVEDLSIMEPGEKYEDNFRRSLEALRGVAELR